ncbi:Importin subunit beta-1 [Camellia lanceoleosa]|uniref:Importin subunit beta-1 n=1 Tax=Camellia lanceoleosa TaxID=1840588 RepID=A0ACC0GYK9_9ERIC|nr:Importin subunit beta-1 [Camellia lanceoleosa]
MGAFKQLSSIEQQTDKLKDRCQRLYKRCRVKGKGLCVDATWFHEYVVDQDHVNKILIAVVQGMNASEGSIDVGLAATRALYNALGFT